MACKRLWTVCAALLLSALVSGAALSSAAMAQSAGTGTGTGTGTSAAPPPSAAPPAAAQQPAPAQQSQTPPPLDEDELEVLVARIALYPDELVALISSASLFPLQIVEAARFLERHAKDKSLKPKDSWDGSVISLLNYPEIVRMMSDDLDWTQSLGDALTYQQKDVLVAIQQLREEAIAKNIIKSDDKIKITQEQDNVIIQSASPDQIYIPRYAPEMFYEPGYAVAPVSYYPDAYPSYFYPGATFFAGAITGGIFAAAVDWNRWGVWGGRWRGDVDINCNRCLNNVDINGKLNARDIDWRNVDRSKISIDKDQFAKFDRANIRNDIQADRANSFKEKAATVRRDNPAAGSGRASQAGDIRRAAIERDLKTPGAGARPNITRPDAARPAVDRGNINRPAASRPVASRPDAKRPAQVSRPSGPPKAAARIDNRPARPSGLGQVQAGRVSQIQSHRGAMAMSGAHRGGGAHMSMPRGGGGGRQMSMPRGGGGGHVGMRGGGGGGRRR